MTYEQLIRLCPIPLNDLADLPNGINGMYIETTSNDIILLDRSINNSVEKTCILSEEIGHYYTAVGDFTDQTKLENRKKERLGRVWGYELLISLDRIIDAGQAGIEGCFAIAEYLEVTEEFLRATIEHYQRKYGIHTLHDGYLIYFEPLSITKMRTC